MTGVAIDSGGEPHSIKRVRVAATDASAITEGAGTAERAGAGGVIREPFKQAGHDSSGRQHMKWKKVWQRERQTTEV